MNRFWCKLAQVSQWAKARNDQLCGPVGQRWRRADAERGGREQGEWRKRLEASEAGWVLGKMSNKTHFLHIKSRQTRLTQYESRQRGCTQSLRIFSFCHATAAEPICPSQWSGGPTILVFPYTKQCGSTSTGTPVTGTGIAIFDQYLALWWLVEYRMLSTNFDRQVIPLSQSTVIQKRIYLYALVNLKPTKLIIINQ